jgi:hypothetical protein
MVSEADQGLEDVEAASALFPNVSRHCSITSGMPLAISAVLSANDLKSPIRLVPFIGGASARTGSRCHSAQACA